MWLIETCVCVTYLAHMYSNSVIVVFVVNAICMRMLVGEMTVNDDALLSLSCPPLLSYYVLVHWSYACVEREREAKRKSRVANRRRQSEGQESTHRRERESRKDRTSQGWRERKKNASKSNGRLFDALTLVVVRALVGDCDDVLFSASLLVLHFSLALFCTACNIWFVQSHGTAYFSCSCFVLFPCSSLFFSAKRPTTTVHNEITTHFPSSPSSEV